MRDQEVKLIVGSLLHDIGKVIYRTGDGRNHSRSGYDYLREEIGIDDKDILDSVLYHHADMLRSANISNDSNAYITYIADNIASATDRRGKEKEDYGFEMSMPLQPVFNILNGNSGNAFYSPDMLKEDHINYPVDEQKSFDQGFYNEVKSRITDTLKGIKWDEHYINSILSVLEATMSYLPSSTSKGEVADISLFDHVKLTAAISSCIYQYMNDSQVKDYREYLYKNAQDFYGKKAFLLYSMDLSGIQDFIYTIHSKDALKTLRARSFYLEIMMEHMIDTLLERLSLSRANLLYAGGGHCYMILPNTAAVKDVLAKFMGETNEWLTENYDIALYVADGYAEASADNLKNVPEKSYGELFKNMSNAISEKKSNRYMIEQIKNLNGSKKIQYSRECRICKRLDRVNEEGVCSICDAMRKSSKAIMNEQFFVITSSEVENGLPLPCGAWMIAESEQKLRNRMQNQPQSLLRAYSKNRYYTGLDVAARIWVGNYSGDDCQTMEDLARHAFDSGAVRRIGVLRADVDNMGQAFTSGFAEKYNTISRTATLSRQLSMFFKCYINTLLSEKEYMINESSGGRSATIVYSGGDDLFIVGAWNDIVELAVDIRRNFKKYTLGTLTLSAGIGMYDSGYPISRIAYEVGDLEEDSKNLPGKDAITLLPDGKRHSIICDDGKKTEVMDATYKWDTFEKEVVGDKYDIIKDFFDNSKDRGNAFLYRLLELIRGQVDEKEDESKEKDPINFARYVYLLARLEPDKEAGDEQKLSYKKFSKKMYKWIESEDDCRQLKTAINMYVYMTRESEEGMK